ncbi:leucine-rich repeat-containing protein 29 isoform X1 [Otolemur garnettii]|uniref:leucine-rich repeat-containing protein 29 isoform X1 n=1 Tax=Otolemur garnettii TaxID=30611 RepID=UPI000C7EC904|nr:leucine-rich repeat-containing protein 29 isoform X1 [Otolemur garnettii]
MAESLPLEMLTYILSFLPLSDQKEASLVSRAWYCAAQNALRETNVRYNIPVSSASLPAIKSLGLRGISCISLTDLDGSPTSQQVLQSVAHHMGPHLQSLCLGGGSPTEASFVALVLGCPVLRILDLSGCNSLFTSGKLLSQPEMAQSVRRALSGLRELNLAGLRDLADLSFNQLSSCTPSLERLSLAYCHLTFELGPAQGSIGPQDSSPSQFSFRNLLRFVKERAGRLHALDLSGTGLPPEALQALGQVTGLQLQELSLHSCRELSTEAVATLCRQQPGLTSLDLSGCSELTDGALLAVSRGLRHLRCLSLGKLRRLTDAGCAALGGLHELQNLNMAECCLVSGKELAQALGSMHRAPSRLVSLSLAFCSSLKDASVRSVIPALGPSLRVLDLSSCVTLTNRTVQAICTYLTHLSVLRLAWCKELRDWGLLGLGEPREEPAQRPQVWDPHSHGVGGGPWAQLLSGLSQNSLGAFKGKLRKNLRSRDFFPQPQPELEHQLPDLKHPSPEPQGPSLLMLQALQELDLTACSKLTDASLAKVLQFPQLRQLSLSLLPALTDMGLVAVARGCPSLERLALSHCTCLSDEGWAQAASSWPRLQHLNLSSCSQLTEQTLDTIGQVCKQLRVLDVAMCSGINMAAVRRFQAQLPQVTCIQSRFVGGADLTLTL